jgi:hypothetical protein
VPWGSRLAYAKLARIDQFASQQRRLGDPFKSRFWLEWDTTHSTRLFSVPSHLFAAFGQILSVFPSSEGALITLALRFTSCLQKQPRPHLVSSIFADNNTMDIGAFLVALLSDWLGWMSSLGSVALTTWIVLRPTINKKRAYLVLAVACCTTASVHIWTKEHRARLQAEDGNKPAMVVKIVEVMVGKLPGGATTLTVVAEAINHGAPSIYCFESLSAILPNGKSVTGKLFLPPPTPYLKLSGAPGTPDLYLRRSDYLNDKGIGPPISRGGAIAGWIIVVLPNIRPESMPRDTRILLEGTDAYGRRISAQAALGSEDPWNRLYNPNAVENWNPQP